MFALGGLTVDSGDIYPKSTIPQFPTCNRTADPHPVSTTCLLVVDMSLVSNPHRHETPSPFLTTKSTEFLALHRPVPASTRLLGFRHTVPASGDRDKPRFFFQLLFAIRETTDCCGGASERWTASAACRRHARLENKGDKDKAWSIRAEQVLL